MANKVLVAVFSASGVTKRVGQEIARISGGDFFEIVPAEKYTNADLNYMNSRSRSSVEMNDPSVRPAIAGRVSDMDSYDTVIIGFPIWWGVAPRIIETLLESYDFSGKTIIPFNTHMGSGNGGTYDTIRELEPKAKVLTGLPVEMRDAENGPAKAVEKWLKSLR